MHTTRREFLLRSGLLSGIGLLVAACSPAAPAPTAGPANPTAPKPAATTAPAAPAATTAPAAAPTTAPTAAAKTAGRVPAGELKVALPAKLVNLDPYGANSVEEVLHTSIQHVLEPLVR